MSQRIISLLRETNCMAQRQREAGEELGKVLTCSLAAAFSQAATPFHPPALHRGNKGICGYFQQQQRGAIAKWQHSTESPSRSSKIPQYRWRENRASVVLEVALQHLTDVVWLLMKEKNDNVLEEADPAFKVSLWELFVRAVRVFFYLKWCFVREKLKKPSIVSMTKIGRKNQETMRCRTDQEPIPILPTSSPLIHKKRVKPHPEKRRVGRKRDARIKKWVFCPTKTAGEQLQGPENNTASRKTSVHRVRLVTGRQPRALARLETIFGDWPCWMRTEQDVTFRTCTGRKRLGMVVGDEEIWVQGGQRAQDGQFAPSSTLNKSGSQFTK